MIGKRQVSICDWSVAFAVP